MDNQKYEYFMLYQTLRHHIHHTSITTFAFTELGVYFKTEKIPTFRFLTHNEVKEKVDFYFENREMLKDLNDYIELHSTKSI